MFPQIFRNAQGETRTANNEQEAQALQSQGFSLLRVQDVDATGQARVRSATGREVESGDVQQGQFVEDTPEVEAALSNRREGELFRAGIDAGDQALAGLSAAASTSTLGLTSQLGLDSRAGLTEEERAIYDEETSLAQGLGTIGGALNPFGAENLAGRGIAWLARGAGATSRAGRLAAGATRFATEGAVGGAAVAIENDALRENTPLTAERLAASMGVGALFGLGAGGGVSALGVGARGLGNLFRRRSPVQEVADEVGEALTDSLVRDPVTGQALPQGVATSDQGTFGRFQSAVSTNSRNILGYNGADPLITRLAQEANELGPTLYRQATDVLESANKATDDLLESLSRTDNIPVGTFADDAGELVSREIRTAVDDVFGDLTRRGITSEAGQAIVRQAQEAVEAAGSLPTTAPIESVLGAVGGARQNLDRIIRDVGDSADPGVLPALRDLRGRLEGVSRDTSIFGDSASALERRATLVDDLQRAKRGTQRLFRNVFPEGDLATASPQQLRQVFESAANAGDREGLQVLENWVTTLDEASLAARELGIEAVDEALPQALRESLGEITPRVVAQQVERVGLAQEGLSGGAALALGQAVGAGAFLVTGDPSSAAAVGLGAGLVGAFLRKPVGTNRLLNRLRNEFLDQSTRLSTSADSVRTSMTSKLSVPFAADRIAVRAGTAADVYENGSPSDQEQAYRVLSDRVEQLANSPEELARVAASQGEYLDTIGEDMPAQLSMQMMQLLGAAAGALPGTRRGAASRPSLMSPPPQPSSAEMQGFLRVASVLEDPVYAVQLMQHGRLDSSLGRAVAQAYPQFHQEVSAQLIEDMAEVVQSGESVNYQMALQISNFTGMQLDESMSGDFILAMQDQSAQTPEQESAQFSRDVSTRRTSFGDNNLTPSQRVSQ